MAENATAADTGKLAKIGSSEMTEKVGKMLRQAESLPEGSPERETFLEKAYTLAQAYTIDMDLARAKQAKKEKVEEPEERQYQVGSRKGSSRRKSQHNAHLAELLTAIGEVYNMKAMIGGSEVYVWLTGFPSDHDMVERLFALLSVQMISEADAALKRGDHKERRIVPITERVPIPEEERAWGKEVNPDDFWDEKRYAGSEVEVGWEDEYWGRRGWVRYTMQAPPTHRRVPVLDSEGREVFEEREVSEVDGRVWRKNFYQGFIIKTRHRLWASRRKAMAEAGIEAGDTTSEKGLVLLDKKEQIADHFEKVVLSAHGGADKVGTWSSPEVSQSHWGGRLKGEDAATKARHGDEMDLGSGQ